MDDFSFGVEYDTIDEDDEDIDDELVFIKFADDMEEDEDVAVDDEEAIDEPIALAAREALDVDGGGGVRIFDLLLFLM